MIMTVTELDERYIHEHLCPQCTQLFPCDYEKCYLANNIDRPVVMLCEYCFDPLEYREEEE
jgi:hypothetical protein